MDQEMVEKYIDLTVKIAHRIGNMHKRNREGVMAESFLELCEISDDLRDQGEGYLVMRIRQRAQCFIAADRIIPVSKSTIYRKGISSLPKIFNIADGDPSGGNDYSDTSELLDAANLNGRELYVATSLEKGYTFDEVADDLKVTTRTLRTIRNSIGMKLLNVMNDEHKCYMKGTLCNK